VLERFPDDRRLQFTEVLVDAIIQTVSRDADGPSAPERPDPTNRFDSFSAPERLRPFLDDPILGPEAHLWSGLVLGVSLRRVTDAMPHFEAASRSEEAFVAHLAHYWAGRFQEAAGRLREAELLYRAALDVQPRAQSASLSLSALLFRLDDVDEAYSVIERAFESPQPADPFKTYGFGDYRYMDGYLDQLRSVVAR
jgi:tetratricopeptide (TPR) repeat protein